jgi:ribosomal protein S18 acetylase RimI-like enzyme
VQLPVNQERVKQEPMITIRKFDEKDWASVWKMIEPVFRAGDTYPFPTNISEDEAYQAWITVPTATFVAEDESKGILGTYYIKPNQPGQGSHICNCGYIVLESARGKGIASQMCDHSQEEALSQGFSAMQYNLVVSTNESAVHLWKKKGFEVIGTIPEAYNQQTIGFVDAFIMYKKLSG